MSNQHIVKHPEGWAVKGEGNHRYTVICDTQAEAVKEATDIAKNQGGDVLIHNRKNLIRARNTYGKPDPFPPPG